MRRIAFALVFALAASPAFARGKKGPKDGQYCSKKMIGKSSSDKSGATLTCKADDKGKLRWTK
jgi:hypothetical protein